MIHQPASFFPFFNEAVQKNFSWKQKYYQKYYLKAPKPGFNLKCLSISFIPSLLPPEWWIWFEIAIGSSPLPESADLDLVKSQDSVKFNTKKINII